MSSAQRSIPRRLFDLALPVIGLNVLSVLALVVDTMMVGHLADSEVGLTALGFATQVIFLLMVAMMGLTVGTVALVSRAHGGADLDRVNHLLSQSTWLTVGVGVGVALVGNLTARYLLMLLGAEGAALEQGLAYLRPLLTFTVFGYLNMLYAAVLRGVGRTIPPFVVALVSNALNVVLNYGLILGHYGLPELGVGGAAWGTVASQAVGTLLLIGLLRRGVVEGLRLPLRPPRFDRALARELMRVGGPAALDMVIMNVAFMSIVGMLGRLTAVAVAAHGIGLRVQTLAFVPGLSISQATGAMVGHALGANDIAQARAVVRASVVLCTLVMSSLGALFVLGAAPMVAAFDVAPGGELADLSVLWIELLGYGMPIVGVNIAFIGMFRGAGATRTSLNINLFATLLFQVPASYLLGFTFGLGPLGVWVAFPLAFGIKALLGFVVYVRGSWARTGL